MDELRSALDQVRVFHFKKTQYTLSEMLSSACQAPGKVRNAWSSGRKSKNYHPVCAGKVVAPTEFSRLATIPKIKI